MSKIKQGILGAGSGKVGGVIMSSWKGIATLRSMPASVDNPNTSAQQSQRSKFTQAVACARLLLAELIHPFWDPFMKGMSGYNAFIQKNIDCFDATGLKTPEDFVASRGVLVGISNFSANLDAGSLEVSYFWDNNSGVGDALATDLLVAVIYNETQKKWFVSTSTWKRQDKACAFTILGVVSTDILHAYGFFRRPDISKISDSSHSAVPLA